MAKVHSREYTNGAGCASRIEKRWDMRGLVNGESVKAFFFFTSGSGCKLIEEAEKQANIVSCQSLSGLLHCVLQGRGCSLSRRCHGCTQRGNFFLFFDQTPSPLTACRARTESLIQPCLCRPVGRKSFGRATGGLLAVVRIQIKKKFFRLICQEKSHKKPHIWMFYFERVSTIFFSPTSFT